MVTYFSVAALPIGMKFCTAVWPHLGQVFSHFGGIVPRMAKLWASTGQDMLLAETLVFFLVLQTIFITQMLLGCIALIVQRPIVIKLSRG